MAKVEQESKAKQAEAVAAKQEADVDPRLAIAQEARARQGGGAKSPHKGGPNKGGPDKNARKGKGTGVDGANRESEQDEDDDSKKEEESEAEKELFWKHLVWGAYRSKKRRDEE